jgi:hypothetical protein
MGNGPSVSKALTFSAKGIVKSVSEALSVTLFTMSFGLRLNYFAMLLLKLVQLQTESSHANIGMLAAT